MENKFQSEEELVELPYFDVSLPLKERIQDLLARLTTEEKFKLIAGKDMWQSNEIQRLGIKSINMGDGPHGFRNATSTFFSNAKCHASTWNPELSTRFGVALAEEFLANGYHIVLGPGINIDRTPLNGRTFEYFTEDPHLNGRIAVNTVKGIQSKKVAACIKHFVANNQEKDRFIVNAEISERALQEIYLPAFKKVVEEADPWTVMACYNKINGNWGCNNKDTLIKKLREEYGFKGLVMTDWWATAYHEEDLAADCLNHGLNLEMPGMVRPEDGKAIEQFTSDKLQKAFLEGRLTPDVLDQRISEMLRVMFFVGLFDDPNSLPKGSINTIEHQSLAREIAEEGIVLLKNDGILPLNKNMVKSITVLGPNMDAPMGEGGGAASISSPYEITGLEGLKLFCRDNIEIKTDINDAENSDAVILFLGLNHDMGQDCENGDRTQLELSQDQQDLIDTVSKKNKNTIVVLINGSPVSFDTEKVPAIIEAWYAGLEAGTAIAKIIFGDVNPSGKLPITFPRTLSDSPAHKSERTYPGVNNNVYYEEGIFVGYRHFDSKNIDPLFPFGHGLSYTNFSYSDLSTDKSEMAEDEKLEVCLNITNTGDRYGAEVVQLYIEDVESELPRPKKELKGFSKVFLDVGEKSSVKFVIGKDDLSYYSEEKNAWVAEKGTFRIHVGSSSKDIRATIEFTLK